MVTAFMQSAAKDLDIEVNVLYSNRNRYNTLKIAKEILSAPDKPDYLIFHFQEQVGPHILQAAEDAEVYSFVINTGAPEADKLNIGKPRGKYKYWLGHMHPDDEHAGFLLASVLANKALKLERYADDGKVHIVGLSGAYDSTASIDRSHGLQRFAKQQTNVELEQVVYADWDTKNAHFKTGALLSRYPSISVVWTASDVMSFGAMDAIEKRGLNPGVQVIIGGMDGTRRAMNAIKDGRMTATIAGHFVEGGWAMVLLHDHYHGIDFADSIGTTIRTKMRAITSENVQHYIESYVPGYWDQINFKSFSKKYNPDKKNYRFRLPCELPTK